MICSKDVVEEFLKEVNFRLNESEKIFINIKVEKH